MNLLAQLFCSQVRAELFRELFGIHDREIHLRELQRQTGFALATVRQDVEKLAEYGLVTRRKDGNRLYYRANHGHPLFSDLRNIVLKTVGLADNLRSHLQVDGIRVAFVFGSVAAERDVPSSDIDLMILGEIGLRRISHLLQGQGELLGREINPHVMNPSEFRTKVRRKDHFVSSVLTAPKLFLIGCEDDLEAMA